VVIKQMADAGAADQEEEAMRTLRVLVGKVGFTAIGVGVGLILAAGSGAAAVQFTRSMASEHSINVVQPDLSHDGSVQKEDSSASRADDSPEVEPTEAIEPEPSDDNGASKATSGDDKSKASGGTTATPVRSPEPGDDHGGGGNH
jgi:hypothetical protein